uniref:Uncharacterized protein n=1 Tax=Physcomitrium patens TaxID=3218 RepID=A0A2K1IEB8_PHYPA|nr:hypothetical protein PHYPA_029769 [Physcomitrium patens]
MWKPLESGQLILLKFQQKHELKKKEKEYKKLQKEGRKRGTWNFKKADGDVCKISVDAYENKDQELVAENTDLRALLGSMQVLLRAVYTQLKLGK